MDDEALIRAVLDGERRSFRVLVERYEGLVFAIVRSFFGADDRVEDLAQEAFLGAYAGLAGFRPDRGSFATWLGQIARNRCRDALRRRPAVAPSLPDEEQAASSSSDDAELFERLDDALQHLPVERRVAFLLVEVHELPHEQVAEIEGVASGTVRSRVSRARAELRALLEPEMETDA